MNHKNSCPMEMARKGEWAARINPECTCTPAPTCCDKCLFIPKDQCNFSSIAGANAALEGPCVCRCHKGVPFFSKIRDIHCPVCDTSTPPAPGDWEEKFRRKWKAEIRKKVDIMLNPSGLAEMRENVGIKYTDGFIKALTDILSLLD